ncbi:hypothetical protein [Acuticoccus mangrovi]|uniref:Uncharacterized protein n=1 Tax=Acuticoccus mangrovi TaxID=2796142 RepID=A0A934IEW8_9HYPH|nr:hypothetical protein [Acuticoccus mangrovi]MBJ3775354.1 hypothetical protein [Acuticoccus mangrovi]
MSVPSPLYTVALADALLFVPFAVLLGGLTVWRRRRPATTSRVMEIALGTILFVMVGLRYAAMALLALVSPAAIFGADASLTQRIAFAALFVAVAVVGIVSHRGSVGWRFAGALVYAAAALLEAAASLFVWEVSQTALIDTVFTVLLAGVTIILAAFYWTRRTATPNPLGGDGRPFDY